jgi:signal peptidase I
MGRTCSTRRNVPGPVPVASPSRPKEGHRETVEAIAVAFILAFLVRGFVAEAFVIPTGSMAPTLMGRHKEITCPQCGYVYTVNASEEVEGLPANNPHTRRVISGICVNCRYQTRVDDQPSFKGDRILVMKFLYDLPSLPGASEPQRWEVVVFRYPEEPETSYIKRLVGLPGEELRVESGDIYIKPPGSQEFRLQRKPLRHQEAMQMIVYDDAHRARALQGRPEWQRWSPVAPGSWSEPAPGVFVSSASAGEDGAVLRYRHLVPDPEQWEAILNNRELTRPPRSTLITDFYSYNTSSLADSAALASYPRIDQEGAWVQPHWVGDLTLSAKIKVATGIGEVKLELVEGGTPNRCVIDLASGEASLFHGDDLLGRTPTGISGAGTYRLAFANVDDRLTLWVDGRPVFGEGLLYDHGSGGHPAPAEADLTPAAISARGASVTVSDLVLKRDIYYTQYPGRPDYANVWSGHYPRTPAEFFDLLADPKQYAALGTPSATSYAIGRDRFVMMGDNSPRSKDSRGWERRDVDWDDSRREWEVPRSLLTGKAFFVYWPHGKPFGPDIRLGPDFRVPFLPYLERMKWIR